MKTLKVRFKNIEKLHKDEQDMVDYSLVANQMGKPKGRFIKTDGKWAVYEIYDYKEFLIELGRIEMIFEDIIIEVREA